MFELDFRQHEGSLKLELETGIGTLRSVTGYTRVQTLPPHLISDGRYSSAGASSATETYSDSKLIDNTWQENLDFTVNAIDRLDLIIGATYFNINAEKYAPGRANVTYVFPSTDPTKLARTPLSAYSKLSEVQEIFF